MRMLNKKMKKVKSDLEMEAQKRFEETIRKKKKAKRAPEAAVETKKVGVSLNPESKPETKRIKIKNKKKLAYDIFEKNLDKIEEFAPERIKTMTQKAKPHSSAEGRLSVLKREIDPLYEDAKKRAEMSPAPGAYKNGGKVRLAKKGGGRAYGQNS
tara:strand:+ start:59 stop:523 length:465 start_codon:yes stop_codon:yes gene_type:complete